MLFALTMFVSAALLFMVQPMIGRLVLPLVGGSPAAWNTCMVFFQALLLAGYAYAHWLTTRLPAKRQVVVHSSVIAIAIASLALAVFFGSKHTPIAVVPNLSPQGSAYPMFGMLALLGVAVGVPFFVVSTSAPLLQKWFAVTGHPSAKDPYFLYAASNAGSLISLLGYPLFIEPSLMLAHQQWLWAGGFLGLFALSFWCGRQAIHPMPIVGRSPDHPSEAPPSRNRKLKWIALAFVPSSLMLGVTFHMTTDITSMPLLWVPPLALYLLTFIIAFARLPSWFRPVIGNIAPVALLLLVFVLCAPYEIGTNDSSRAVLWLGLHVGVFFLVALMCHTEIAYDRPNPKHLTEYFLWMSFGGMLGGVFNGLIAPVLFPNSWEYPIALAVAAFLVPVFLTESDKPANEGRSRLYDLAVPVGMFVAVALLSCLIVWSDDRSDLNWLQRKIISGLDWSSSSVTNGIAALNFGGKVKSGTIAAFVAYALPCMAAFFCIDRPVRFGLCVCAILLVGLYRNEGGGNLIATKRSYFGILRGSYFNSENKKSIILYKRPDNDSDIITNYTQQNEPHLRLIHGTTLHGMQAAGTWTYPVRDDLPMVGLLSPWNTLLAAGSMGSFDNRQEPLTYYHRTGPVGSLFEETYRRFDSPHVAMIGLGTGSVAAYARPGLPFTFYEIDPAVLEIVDKPNPPKRDDGSKQFTYLADARARGAKIEMVMGDGRLQLERQTDRKYSLLLVDAFSSDSIPLHLLTVEAVTLYMDRLAPNGLLALHISNKYVKLEPVVAAIAKQLGLAGMCFSDSNEGYSGKTSSQWCVLACNDAALGDLIANRFDKGDSPTAIAFIGGAAWWTFTPPPWKALAYTSEVPAWTDDYADVMRVMQMKEIIWLRKLFGQPTPAAESGSE